MDEPPIYCRHLLLCREVVYDPLNNDTPYSLYSMIYDFRPDSDYWYPICAEAVWVFAELFGQAGRYRVRIDVVPLNEDGADAGPPILTRAEIPVRLRPGYFVDPARFRLRQVMFDAPGVYEFRLTLEGFTEPLAATRVHLLER
ncbi:MAG: hypothetical protein ACRC7O_00575 [Fimbriiglobus sp.]